MSAFVELSILTKIYTTPKGPAIIVKDFDLKIEKREFVFLIDHSGCSKSTALSMQAVLNPIISGGLFERRELHDLCPDRGIVFQSPRLLPWLSAFENVMLEVNQGFYTASKEKPQDEGKSHDSITEPVPIPA